MSTRIQILCVDDHPLVREGLARTLGREADMQVVGAVATGEEGVEMFRRFRPDIVLMDLQLPGMSGLRAIEEIRREDGNARIIVLTMYQGDEDIYRALRAGAASYLFKDTLSNDLVSFVREVYDGGRPIPASVASRVASRVPQTGLSPRELDVLGLIASGKQNKEIADALSLSVETVGTHIKHLFAKLGVNDRVTAVTVALSRGMIHLPKS
jgi:two-component system NarL family response regulator